MVKIIQGREEKEEEEEEGEYAMDIYWNVIIVISDREGHGNVHNCVDNHTLVELYSGVALI